MQCAGETEGKTHPSCEHYLRKCVLVSPCCGKVYPCRLCHDSEQNHKLVRSDVKFIECLQCGKRQEVSPTCNNCSITFGKYFCCTCCLFDDKDKGQYHCHGCGICRTPGIPCDYLSYRVGGQDNFFHCDKCGICLGKSIKDSHKCVEKSSRNNCAICLEDLHTSTIAAHVPGCGHLLHSTCFKDLTKSGGYSCPTCNKSLFDMSDVWAKLDHEVAQTPMPDEYRNFEVQILCRDCQKRSKVNFHVIGLKCSECGSYNTARDGDENEPLNRLVLNAGQNLPEIEDSDEEEAPDDDDDYIDEIDHDQDNDQGHDRIDDNGSVHSDFSLD